MSHAFAEPAVVKTLSITEVTTSSVSLIWTQPEGNVTSYLLKWTSGGHTASNTTDDTSFTIIDLTPGVQYDITVAAVAGDLTNKGEGSSRTTFTSRSTHSGESFRGSGSNM